MLELTQMQTLVAVSEAGSFSRAAEQLNVTQSAISQSIKNLENKIGVTLFKRAGKRVFLTAEGEKLFEISSEYILKVSRALDDIKDSKTEMVGKLRIGTLTGVGKSWLSRKVVDFSKKYPDLNIELYLGFPEQLLKDFENYKLDAIVVPEYAAPQIGEKVLIGNELLTLVFPDSEEFNITESINLDELLEYPLILFEENDSLFSKWCFKIFKKRITSQNKRLIINSHGNMLEAVSKGIGMAVLPTHVINRSPYIGSVKTLGEKFTQLNQKFYFVHHKEGEEVQRMMSFKTMLLDSLADDPLH